MQSSNPYINAYAAICSEVVTAVNQVPLIGTLLGLLVGGYCDIALVFISLFPLQAFGLIVPPYIG